MREGHPLRSFAFRILVGALLMSGIVVLLAGALVFFRPRGQVTDVVTSPSGKFQATVTEIDGGAMASEGYSVTLRSLSPESRPVLVANFNDAMKNKDVGGVQPVWVNDLTVEIRYLSARPATLDKASVVLDGQTVTVRLSPPYKMAPAGMTSCDRPGDCPIDTLPRPR